MRGRNMNDKPPFGLKPKNIHNQLRRIEIMTAMYHYVYNYKYIPDEWIKEFQDLNKDLKKVQ
jgi:hypothetical protein